MKRKKIKDLKPDPGTIIKMPVGEYYTYARALNYGDFAFYDIRTKEDIMDLNSIIAKPILFKAVVNYRGLMEGFWLPVGKLPLEDHLKNSIYYWAGPVDSNRFRISENEVIREATREECIGLEVYGVWDPIHIEQRFKDYYAGKENELMKMDDVFGNHNIRGKKV